MQITTEDCVKLSEVNNSGEILRATKRELEHYARVVCSPRAQLTFGAQQLPQIADTVRLLLLVRISEESQHEALRVSERALKVAWIALGVTLLLGLLQVLEGAPGFVREVSMSLQSSPTPHTAQQPPRPEARPSSGK